MNRTIWLAALTIPMLNACGGGGGGGGGDNGPRPPVINTGVFVDSLVQGLDADTASRQNITNSQGEFTYEQGQTVDFSVEQLDLGSATGRATVTPVDLVPGAANEDEPTRNQAVVNVARLIQSLDEDQDPSNGILINNSTRSAAAGLGQAISVQGANLDALSELQNVIPGGALISENQAVQHLNQTLIDDSLLSLYSIGGTVSGLGAGQQVTLALDNSSGDQIVAGNGNFEFGLARLRAQSSYSVTVAIQPAGLDCQVTNGGGVVGSANVTNIAVVCTPVQAPTYEIGGVISGLVTGQNPTLALSNNMGPPLDITQNGPFAFPGEIAEQGAYNVTIAVQPDSQTCAVTNGSGAVTGEDVTDILVECITPPPEMFTLTVTVSGLNGTFILANGSDQLQVTTSGTYDFPMVLLRDDAFDVSVAAQPNGQMCSVMNGMGVAGTDATDNVQVTCENITYRLSVRVNNLETGGTVTATESEADPDDVQNVAVAGGSASFMRDFGAAYSLAVTGPATAQTCSVRSGDLGKLSGTVTGDVDIDVDCDLGIAVTVTGLSPVAAQDALQVTAGGEVLDFTASGSQTLATRFNVGDQVSASITRQAPGSECSVEESPIDVLGLNTEISVFCVTINTLTLGLAAEDIGAAIGAVDATFTATGMSTCPITERVESFNVEDGDAVLSLPACNYNVTLSFAGTTATVENFVDYAASCVEADSGSAGFGLDLAASDQQRRLVCGVRLDSLPQDSIAACLPGLVNAERAASAGEPIYFLHQLAGRTLGTLGDGTLNCVGIRDEEGRPQAACETTPLSCGTFNSWMDPDTINLINTYLAADPQTAGSGVAEIRAGNNYLIDADLVCPGQTPPTPALWQQVRNSDIEFEFNNIPIDNPNDTADDRNSICYADTIELVVTNFQVFDISLGLTTINNPAFLSLTVTLNSNFYGTFGEIPVSEADFGSTVTLDENNPVQVLVGQNGEVSVEFDGLNSALECDITHQGSTQLALDPGKRKYDLYDNLLLVDDLGLPTREFNTADLDIDCFDAFPITARVSPDPVTPGGNANDLLLETSGQIPFGNSSNLVDFRQFLTTEWNAACFGVFGSQSTGIQTEAWSTPSLGDLESGSNGCFLSVSATDDATPQPPLTVLDEGFNFETTILAGIRPQIRIVDRPASTVRAVAPGTDVDVSVSALSSVTGAPTGVTYLWSASCTGGDAGSFADASLASTTWTAPSVIVEPSPGPDSVSPFQPNCTLQVEIGDGSATNRSLTLPAIVSDQFLMDISFAQGQLFVDWSPDINASVETSQYVLQRRSVSDTEWSDTALILDAPFDVRRLTVDVPVHLEPEQYRYRVSAVRSPGNEVFSNEILISPNDLGGVIEQLEIGATDLNLAVPADSALRTPLTARLAGSGDAIAVGLPSAIDNQGAVMVSQRGPARWRETAVLAGYDPGDGLAISNDGSVIAVSQQDRLAIFRYDGNTYIETALSSLGTRRTIFPQTNDAAGASIVLVDNGSLLLAATRVVDTGVRIQGLRFQNQTWQPSGLDTTVPSDDAAQDGAGRTVRLEASDDGTRIVVETSDGIVLVEDAGNGFRTEVIATNSPGERLINPSISGDGARVAYVVFDTNTGFFVESRIRDVDAATTVSPEFLGLFAPGSISRFAVLPEYFGADARVLLDQDGDVLVIGAPFDSVNHYGPCPPNQCGGVTGDGFGAAYVFQRDPSGAFRQVSYLKPPLPHPEFGYGYRIGISDDGETVLVGHGDRIAAGGVFVH